jgi:hypothetical protein
MSAALTRVSRVEKNCKKWIHKPNCSRTRVAAASTSALRQDSLRCWLLVDSDVQSLHQLSHRNLKHLAQP